MKKYIPIKDNEELKITTMYDELEGLKGKGGE